MIRSLLLTFFFLLMLSGWSCKNPETLTDNVEINIERFDRELFMMEQDSVSAFIPELYKKYDDFLDIFSYNITGLGSPSSRDYQAYLKLFINDRINREVFDATQRIFPDLSDLEKDLGRAFTLYRKSFPMDTIPRIVAYVSRFNNPYFTVGNYIGIGLDHYFGTGSEYYKRLELPGYMRTLMFPEKIPSDVIYGFASSRFPFNDSVDNVLTRMIHEGKILYFTSVLLPGEPDSLIIGFTRNQMRWVKENEEFMWTYLVEKKILFSRDPMDIRKLIKPAPFTYFFTNESPGRTGSYIGWQIFKEFARKNPEKDLAKLMSERDYEKILRISLYNP